uniref:Uncharacterized protein n=1 Tax=Arundo donax TaxID=35708 RepID=A0A0A9A9G4_ARUDO
MFSQVSMEHILHSISQEDSFHCQLYKLWNFLRTGLRNHWISIKLYSR